MDISTLLTEARSGDKHIRTNAEAQLSLMANQNFPQLLYLLSEELSNENKLKENRQLSASIIKNSIVYHDKLLDEWKKINTDLKNQIKTRILSSLASNIKEVRKSASSAVAGICKIELPEGKWPEIIECLVSNSFNQNLNFRLASLETLGYICEEINVKSISTQEVDAILTALIKNLNDDACDLTIAQFCLNALKYAISLAEKNFKNKVKI